MSRRRSTRILSVVLAISCVAVVTWKCWKAFAATKTWTGASITNPNPALRNNFWTTPLNWSGSVAPVAGDDLVFAPSSQATSQNTFPDGTSFNSISINSHTITGNSIGLNGDVTAINGQILLSSIKFNNPVTFTAPMAATTAVISSAIDTNGRNLVFDGPGTFVVSGVISGSSSVSVRAGLTIFTGNNSLTGQTNVAVGTLIVNGSQPQSPVFTHSGGTIGGAGTTGNLTVQSVSTLSSLPGKVSPGNVNNGTAVLNVHNVSVTNGGFSSIFEFDLNNTTLGSGYDQLDVTGTVFLSTSISTELSTLHVNLGFLPSPGTSFTIINNDGTDAVTSNFAGLPEGGTFTVNGTTFVISYRGGTGNDVVLRVPQTKEWDGGGTTNNWTEAANWVGDVAPSFGDSLVFPANAARMSNTNDFPAETPFDSISFTGAPYILAGNAIILKNGVTDSVAANGSNNRLQFAAIKLSSNQIFSKAGTAGLFVSSPLDTNGFTLILEGSASKSFTGVISGTGGLTLNGTGVVSTPGAPISHTFSGSTFVNAGRFDMFASQGNSDLTLNGGEFRPLGKVRSIQAKGGVISPQIIPPVFASTGDVTLNSNVTFSFGIQTGPSTSAGTLIVTGTVNLGNANLVVTPVSATPPTPGNSFTIMRKDSAGVVQGTFNNLPDGSVIVVNGIQMVISYVGGDGNDVVLRVPTTRRWDGGSAIDSNWMTKENWEGDTAPVASDNLEFPEGAARLAAVNNFPAGTIFNSITIGGAGYLLLGNAIGLNAGIKETVLSGQSNSVDVPLTLRAAQSFVTAGPTGRILQIRTVQTDHVLTLDGSGPCNIGGVISGSGSITRRGTGGSILERNNTYVGPTIIESGILGIEGSQPTSSVTITNGTLKGSGTTGPLVATGGTVSPGGFSFTTLTVAGNVTFHQDVTLELKTFIINNVPTFGSLKVNGSVNLGGSTLAIPSSNFVPPNATSIVIDNDGSDPINGTFAGLSEGAIITSGSHQFQLSYVGGTGNDVTLTLLPPLVATVQFSTSNFSVAENATQAALTVFRTGDTSSAVTVDFKTVDTDNFTVGCFDSVNNQGSAFGRCDFSTVVGTLQFATNETQKQIVVPIINDVIVEGVETFQVVLENPVGGSLGTLSTATVTIPANDTPGAPNPIFQSPFFVRQHYLDFLSREPEPDGFNAWMSVLNGCPDVNNLDPNSPSAQCDRIIVSQSFFGSQEFHIKGFYAFKFYKLAFNRLPEYLEIISDMSFVAGSTAEEVFQRRAQLAVRFTQRQEFQTGYGSLSNAEFVNALMARYQLTQITTPDPLQPDGTVKVTLTPADLTNRLTAGTLTRAQVFRAIADSDRVNDAEFNNAFVAMQYYGYLRRKPDPAGFNDWLGVLQSGNVRVMINGFMNSQEYRLRFGPPQ